MLPVANGIEEQLISWNDIEWSEAYRIVKNLRCRIFKATQERNWKKVRSLQKLMLRSKANILLSVRKITQENAGKYTAGIDNIVVKTSHARGKLVTEMMRFAPWKAKPVRRIYIPKSNGKVRPLGIPTIKDRCFQAMVKNALEPEWEARFERSSYGFRPGRSCQDAIAKIYNVAQRATRKKWVIDADIKGAFDNISHDFLLKSIGNFPARELIKQWLKAGCMTGRNLQSTETGTPQGSVISPLLANIALNDMDKMLGIKYAPKAQHSYSKRSIVRYADDFVIFTETQEDTEKIIPILTEWLKERGLELSKEKTKIVSLSEGFDFLGFTIRHQPCKRNDKGYHLLITPSKESVTKLRRKLKGEWRKLNGSNIEKVIGRLNPIIRGWANYFRTVVASETFSKLDNWMFKREVCYVKRTHSRKPAYWTKNKYFGRLNLDRTDNWVFGNKINGKHVVRFSWFKIQKHTLVKGLSSPDNPCLKQYWIQRQNKKGKDLISSKQKLAKKQNYSCPVCKQTLFNDEELHIHHHIPQKKGGSSKYENLRLVHMFCHQQLHKERR